MDQIRIAIDLRRAIENYVLGTSAGDCWYARRDASR
jgi:hypothetical protein